MSENRISIFSEHCINLYGVPSKSTLSEAYAAISKIGIGNAEVFDYEFKDCPHIEYGKILGDNNMKASTVISLFFLDDTGQYQTALDTFKKTVDAAGYLESDNVMIVPVARFVKTEDDKKFARDSMIDCLQKLVEYNANPGLNICIENFSTWQEPFSTIEEVRFILENVNRLKYNFDPGNFYCVYEDALRAYETLKGYIASVHLKDWVHSKEGSIPTIRGEKLDGVALGDGVVKLTDVMSLLKNDGYKGKYTIEINTHRQLSFEVLKSYNFIMDNM